MLPSYHPHQDKSAFVKGSEISVNDVSSVKEYSCMQVSTLVSQLAS